MLKYVFVYLIFLLFYTSSYAQDNKFEFDFQQQIGELDSSDLVKEGMGRYDGYEIPLYKGEMVQFVLYSEEFNPILILASPDGRKIKQSLGEQYNFARISMTIPEDGEYILYVVSDTDKTGQYFLQNAIGPESAFSLPPGSPFCDRVAYILAHARASFQLLGGSEKSSVILDGTIKSYLDSEDGSYHSILYEGKKQEEAEKKLSDLDMKISDCLGDNWKKNAEQWKTEGNYKLRDTIFSGNDSLGNHLLVILRLYDLQKVSMDPTRPITLEAIFKIVQ